MRIKQDLTVLADFMRSDVCWNLLFRFGFERDEEGILEVPRNVRRSGKILFGQTFKVTELPNDQKLLMIAEKGKVITKVTEFSLAISHSVTGSRGKFVTWSGSEFFEQELCQILGDKDPTKIIEELIGRFAPQAGAHRHNLEALDMALGVLRDCQRRIEQGNPCRLNINYSVWVRLTEYGTYVLKEFHTRTQRGITIPQEDPRSDQWMEFQIWRLMQIFGPSVHLAMEAPFVNNEISLVNPN